MATDATLVSGATNARDAVAAKMGIVQISEARRPAKEWTDAVEKRQ